MKLDYKSCSGRFLSVPLYNEEVMRHKQSVFHYLTDSQTHTKLLCHCVITLTGFPHSLRHLVVVRRTCRPQRGNRFNPFCFMEKHHERGNA